MTAPETRAVLAALAAGAADARFVGGCVRDAWLGRPVHDIDLATHASPERVLALLEDGGVRAIPTGLAHGTVTAVVGKAHYEITTLRRDVESFGRHARVAFTDDWREDASRRDFTMNALSCTPDGVIYDPFGGLADLAAGRVRFVGNAAARITEDVLRLMRFFRFHAHYGRGAPDAEALAACAALADRLPALSGERVRGEILRLLTAPDPGTVWRLMQEQGVLAHLLPVPTDAERLDRLVMVERPLGEPAEPVRRLAAAVPRRKAAALAVAERLKLSNAERDRLAILAEPPDAVPTDAALLDGAEATRRLALYRLGEAGVFGDLVHLAAADAPGPVPSETVRAALSTAGDLPALRFPLAGRDLARLGVRPGPGMGTLLKAVHDWWLARDFRPDREACLAEARRLTAAG